MLQVIEVFIYFIKKRVVPEMRRRRTSFASRRRSLIKIIFQEYIEPSLRVKLSLYVFKKPSIRCTRINHPFRNINGNLAEIKDFVHWINLLIFLPEPLTCTYEMLSICKSNVHTEIGGQFRR
jgi:hypothetical protein